MSCTQCRAKYMYTLLFNNHWIKIPCLVGKMTYLNYRQKGSDCHRDLKIAYTALSTLPIQDQISN